VELRWTVQCVDAVGVGVDAVIRRRDVVPGEPYILRRLALVYVRGDDPIAPLNERRRDGRAVSDPDLDEPSAVAPHEVDESVRERVRVCRFHGGMFMRRGGIALRMRVDIVPIGDVPATVKREASSGLRRVYDCEVSVAAEQDVPEDAYDSGRRQYRAEPFIEVARRAGGGGKNVAVTPVDLFYRQRNYVFGLAYLDGRGCVVSTHRLQTSSDGGFSQRSASDIFADRVRKEVVHEIGHTLGLEHCDNNRCAMSFSPQVTQVDRKEETLCGSCQRLVL